MQQGHKAKVQALEYKWPPPGKSEDAIPSDFLLDYIFITDRQKNTGKIGTQAYTSWFFFVFLDSDWAFSD